MHLLVRQPAGLGDVFFCQKIAAQIAVKFQADSVIWPVLPHFLYIRDYLEPTIVTEFVSTEDKFKFKERYLAFDSLPRGTSQRLTPECLIINLHGHIDARGTVMKPKYEVLGVDWSNWLDYFHFKRNHEREKMLWNHLGLGDNEPFIFVNRNFASPPGILTCDRMNIAFYPSEEPVRVLEMRMIEGFNLFDWCMVLEKALAIYTVETSICYLIEKLNTTNRLFMYARNKIPDWYYIEGIFQKPWVYEK
jgi:hypothetical protein